MKPGRRRRYLIEPALQIRFVLAFLSTAATYTLLQAFVLYRTIASAAVEYPEGEEILVPAFTAGMRTNLMLTGLVLVPLTVAIGVYMTFQLAGPLYRFRTYLGQVAAGEETGPCGIRKGDQLQNLCDAINGAVDRLRRDAGKPAYAESRTVGSDAAGPNPVGSPTEQTDHQTAERENRAA